MPRINYISYVSDYFPLLLILSIALSGIYMRYYAKVDVIAIKTLTMGLMTHGYFTHVPETIAASFFVHVFLVSTLMVYFRSPSSCTARRLPVADQNMPNDTRAKHHVNPWNDPKIKAHAYEDYEKEFGVPCRGGPASG